MKQKPEKIQGEVKPTKPRIGVWHTRVALSEKDKRRTQLKDLDKMMKVDND